MNIQLVSDAPTRPRAQRFDTVHLLQIFIVLLFLIPTRLRFPLGPVGQPSKLVALVMFLMWTVTVLAPSLSTQRRVGAVRAILVLFWMSLLISYALMNRHAVVADELANSDRTLIDFIPFTGVVLVAAEGIPSMADLMRVLRTFVAGVAAMSAIAIAQSRLNFDLTQYIAKIPLLSTSANLASVLNRSGFNRPAGTATHPIEFGIVVALGLAFALHLALYDRNWSRSKRWGCLALIAFGIPIAVSRSALLVGTVVLVAFLSGTTRARRRRTIPALIGFFMVIFVAVPGLLGTLRGYIFAGESDSSISTRTDDYAAVSPYLRQSPWVGHGPGTFLPRIRILDNQYLLTLIETGILGLLVVLALFGTASFLGRSGRKCGASEAHRNLGQMFAGASVGVMVGAATYDAFSFPMFTSSVALLTGLAGAYWRLSRSGDLIDRGGPAT